MTTVTHEQIIDVPADAAWAVLKDFGDFLRWASIPGTLEGDGIGMVRHMDTPEMGKWAEKFDVADDATMTYGYTLVYGTPIGMGKYTARVHIEAVDNDRAKLSWRGEFEAAQGHDAATVAGMLKGAYANMSGGLEAEVKNQ